MIPAPGGGLSYDEAEELSNKEEGEKGMALMQAEQRASPLVDYLKNSKRIKKSIVAG